MSKNREKSFFQWTTFGHIWVKSALCLVVVIGILNLHIVILIKSVVVRRVILKQAHIPVDYHKNSEEIVTMISCANIPMAI